MIRQLRIALAGMRQTFLLTNVEVATVVLSPTMENLVCPARQQQVLQTPTSLEHTHEQLSIITGKEREREAWCEKNFNSWFLPSSL